MKVIRHNEGGDYTNYTIRKANGVHFNASYSKRLGTFAWQGGVNEVAVIEAVWFYHMKRSAWWSVPMLATILAIVLYIGRQS